MEQKHLNGAHLTEQRRIVQKMNELRALHGANPLNYDEKSDLTRLAQELATETVQTAQLCHTVTKDFGQNLFMMSSDWNFDVETGVLFWYNEIDKYDESRPQWQDGCGHFTQLVWKASEEVGIGVACGNGFLVIVGNFYPKGNVYGQFEDNVSKDKTQSSFPIDV